MRDVCQRGNALANNPSPESGFLDGPRQPRQPSFARRASGRSDRPFPKGAANQPRYAQAHDNLGTLFRNREGWTKRSPIIKRRCKSSPASREAHYNMGNALLQEGKTDEAIAHFQKALQINPDHADARINLGNVLLPKGQRGRSDHPLSKRPSKSGPATHKPITISATLFCKRAKWTKQSPISNRCWKSTPATEKHTATSATLFCKRETWAGRSRNIKRRCNSNQPNRASKIIWPGSWPLCPEASLRDGNKAVELARQANGLTGGENPIILHTLAAAYAEAGRFSEAVETAQHAMRLAEAQSNAVLAGQLQSELILYQAGSPLHIPAQTH